VPTFASPEPVLALTTALQAAVADADAAFQIRQQVLWSRVALGTPLLEGFDRLANLGLVEVRVTMALVAVRPRWWRRLWNRLSRAPDQIDYRLRTDADAVTPAAMELSVVICRDAGGRWTASPSPSRPGASGAPGT
jgi:hypothetical protein